MNDSVPLKEKAALLRKVNLFEGFSPEALDLLAGEFRELSLQPGETLFREGDSGNTFYIIVSGELGIYRLTKRITARMAGEYIGEMALIETGERSATARAHTAVVVLEGGLEMFNRIFTTEPLAVITLMKTLSRRIQAEMDETAQELLRLNLLNHDMQNCLVSLNYLEGFLNRLYAILKSGQSKARDDVESCCRILTHLKNDLGMLIEQSLTHGKKLEPVFVRESHSLVSLARAVVEEVSETKIFQTRKIQVHDPGGMGLCPLNYLDIKRVLLNLLFNAAEATQEGDVIDIDLEDRGKEVQVTVRDPGCGVFEELKTFLLHEVLSTKPGRNGFGLLSCRAIIEDRHRGKIWFESAPGQGAAFHFTLPRDA